MKKRLFLLLSILLLIPFTARAETLTYEEACKAVKQSIQAWYMRGSYRQYNSPKNTHDVLRHPEDATIYDMGYSVCAGFTNDVWMEAFGFKAANDNVAGGHTPAGSGSYCTEARQYIDEQKCKSPEVNHTGCKGEFVVYYYNKNDGKEYIYSPSRSRDFKEFSNLLTLLQPGDILAFDGHVVVLYDFKYDANGKRTDALLFESRGRSNKTLTRISEDSYYNLLYFKGYTKNADGKRLTNGLLDLNDNTFMKFEGTTKWVWLSEYSFFIDPTTKYLKCTHSNYCSITRAFYKDANGNAAFNYDIEWPEQINSSKARIEMPGLFIHKTSSKTDNNSVNLNDRITYYINVTNNSNLAAGESKNYNNIYVKEYLPAQTKLYGTHVGDSPVGSYDKNAQTVTWKITSLKAGESVTIKYSVDVRDNTKNIGSTFESTGIVYKSNENNHVNTGTIKLEIVNNTTATNENYKDCYDESVAAKKTGVDLIEAIYQCVYKNEELPFSFTGFNKDKIMGFVERKTNPSMNNTKAIHLNKTGEYKIFADMVLNNYWGGLVKSNYLNSTTTADQPYFFLPVWREKSTSTYVGNSERAKTIVGNQFEPGDVLIYYIDNTDADANHFFTKENGLYAYIYIEEKVNGTTVGKFKGVNYSGTKARNEFTVDYYNKNNGLDPEYNLYTGPSSYYETANWQTLLGKDAYVIFRPEKVITQVTNLTVKTQPTKTAYFKKQALDLTGGVLTATYNDGTKENVDMTDAGVEISNYNPNTVGTQTVTVSYRGKTTTFNVTVSENSVTSVNVYKAPSKTSYYTGDAIDLTGGIIKVNYADGSSVKHTMKIAGASVTGFDSSTSGTKNLTVAYGGKTATFNVQVANLTYDSLTIKNLPGKTTYVVGDTLSLEGGVLEKNFNSGATQEVPMTDSSVSASGFNSSSAGTKTVTLSLGEKSVTFDVVVNQPLQTEEGLVLQNISIHRKPQTTYNIGESLNLWNGQIKALFTKEETDAGGQLVVYGLTKIIGMGADGMTVSDFDSTTEGEKTITITYGGKTTTFTVNVVKTDPVLKSIEISKSPRKGIYIQNQEDISAIGGELTKNYSDGSKEVVPLTDSNVEILDFDNSESGEKQVVVSYNGLETSFNVNVIPEQEEEIQDTNVRGAIQSVEVIQNKGIALHNPETNAVTFHGIILRVHYEDGTIENIDLEDYPGFYTITSLDLNKLEEQDTVVNFKGHEILFRTTVQTGDTVITSPDTLAKRSIILIIMSLIFVVSGTVIINATKNKNNA